MRDVPETGLVQDEHGGYRGHIPFADKLSYGIGQFGEGLQGSAAVALLMFFYSQVIGLSAAVVGLGIALTGVLNALLDAFIGSWSDVTRHRLGRRHPYLYWAPVPAGIGMVMLFSPPGILGPSGLFIWLLLWYTVMRAAMSIYLVPHWALGAELSADSHERTGLVSSRIVFSFLGTGGFFIFSLLFFNGAHSSVALLSANHYFYLAAAISVLVIISELWSAYGTRRYIPYLPIAPKDAKALTFSVLWREVKALFTNKAFKIFFIGSLIMAVCVTTRALDIYMGVYFWHLPSSLTLLLSGLSMLAFASGTFFWAGVSKRIGKKNTFIFGIAGYGVIMAILPVLKISGLFVPEESGLYFPAILTVSMVGYVIQSSYGVMSGAILPDVVDDYFRQTGRRMAGIITSFLFVIVTLTAAGSQLLAGLVLTLIGLQPKAIPADVPVDVPESPTPPADAFTPFPVLDPSAVMAFDPEVVCARIATLLPDVAFKPYCEVLVPRRPVPLLLVPMTPIPELLLFPLMHQFEPVTEQVTVVTATRAA